MYLHSIDDVLYIRVIGLDNLLMKIEHIDTNIYSMIHKPI